MGSRLGPLQDQSICCFPAMRKLPDPKLSSHIAEDARKAENVDIRIDPQLRIFCGLSRNRSCSSGRYEISYQCPIARKKEMTHFKTETNSDIVFRCSGSLCQHNLQTNFTFSSGTSAQTFARGGKFGSLWRYIMTETFSGFTP